MAKQLQYWKLAIWKGINGSLIVILGTMPSAILNWETMTVAGKVVACSGMLLALLKFLDGFTDQTAARLAAGKPLVMLPGEELKEEKP